MKRAFISHSTRDQAYVAWLCLLLHQCGVTPWLAGESIRTGRWPDAVLKGMQSSEFFLLVFSKHSIVSEHVKDEVHWGLANRRQRMLVVCPDDVLDAQVDEFDYRVAPLHRVRLNHGDEAITVLSQLFGDTNFGNYEADFFKRPGSNTPIVDATFDRNVEE